ncbi:2-amino-4-hydroxy-6-hydroxymethyldihydropteridine diphosphokinase [Spirochaetota bacterium]
MKYKDIYLSLGSNIGDRRQNIEKAIEQLHTVMKIEKRSSFYETSPVDYSKQDDFINICLCGASDLTPHEFLSTLKQIEKHLGRKNDIVKGPRIIDIDIIRYDTEIIDTGGLIIPHPLYINRRFVLVPLIEINRSFVDVRTGKSAEEHLSELKNKNQQKIKKF